MAANWCCGDAVVVCGIAESWSGDWSGEQKERDQVGPNRLATQKIVWELLMGMMLPWDGVFDG